MRRSLAAALLAIGLGAAAPALAGETTVTLAVKNMYCTACPLIVKSSLQAMPGVTKVAVSYAAKTATVTFDDTKTAVSALTAATTNAGYPSAPKG
jgi:mercuric ion binding protein